MNVIYYSWSGVHSAVVAGSIQLGILPQKDITQIQLSGIPLFDAQQVKCHLHYLGKDSQGNNVFSLGVGMETEMIPRAVLSFLALFNITEKEVKIINASKPLGWFSRLGEKMAYIGWKKLGNWFFLKGIVHDYERMREYLGCQGIANGFTDY